VRINTNIAALNAWRNLTVSDELMAKSLERLSSGLRIAKAADDAAGLAISEKMRAQIGGLKMAQRNAQDGISLIQTAEGGLNETSSILLRMRDLANQATTETLTNDDRSKIVQEFNQLKNELTRIAENTKFNGMVLLDGTLGSLVTLGSALTPAVGITSATSDGAAAGIYELTYDSGTAKMTVTKGGISQTLDVTVPGAGETSELNFSAHDLRVTINENLTGDITAPNNTITVAGGEASIQVGANGNEVLKVEIDDMSVAGLNLDTTAVDTSANAVLALSLIDTSIGTVNTQRAMLGAYQNRLEHTIANLGTTIENLTSAESRIRDVDMALEMASFTKGQILQQAGTAMLAQANQRPQSVMQLLR
jgi:flagellin